VGAWSRCAVLAFGLAGCAHRAPQPGAVPAPHGIEAAELLARGRGVPTPGPLAAGVRVTLASGLSARGSLLVAPGGRVRLDVAGPIGGPLLSVVTDGTRGWAWTARDGRWTLAPELDAELSALAPGAGLAPLGRMLLGLLPDTAGRALEADPHGAVVAWDGPAGRSLVGWVDPSSARLRRLALRAGGGVAEGGGPPTPPASRDVSLEVVPAEAPPHLPARIVVEMGEDPVTVEVIGWSAADPPASAFTWAPPAGAVVRTVHLQPDGRLGARSVRGTAGSPGAPPPPSAPAPAPSP
jgi:hypothetical protein